ncbi:hypothetical protein [Paenibacillus sp. KS-LC4]|uniref:hypothetical protein n=1 Tax=Paenibacillus sp. KS-LC4 TaxID=2979727 RepID=UPI0030D00D82
MHIHVLLQIESQLLSLLSNLHSKVFVKARILVIQGLCSELALRDDGPDQLSARLETIVNRMNACAEEFRLASDEEIQQLHSIMNGGARCIDDCTT